MKKIIMGIVLVLLAFLGLSNVKAETERKYASLPEIVDGTFTNFAWGATMEVGVDTTHSQDGKNAFKLAKTSVSNPSNNGASIYYQQIGTKVKALNVSDYVGLKLTVYNETSISGGLAFMFSGTEVYDVEAYNEEGENLATRNLDYTGYRTYFIPFGTIDIENVNEFQINIWGSEVATIYVSQLEVAYMGEKVEEPERKYEGLPQIVDGTFTNFAWGATMEVGVDTTHSQDGKNAFKLAKTSVSNPSNNGASIYYQQIGAKVKALNVSDYVGLKLTVYNETSISGGLAFMFSGTEVYDVEAYNEEGVNLATRNLDYTGYRTYVIPFGTIDIEKVNEFQINIWGTEAATIYVSQFEVVYTGEKLADSRLKTSLPSISESSFTNFGWNCDMQVEVTNINSANNNNSLKVTKGTINDVANNANVYYQKLGSQVAALGHTEYAGIALSVYNETSYTTSGLMFFLGGVEVTAVEAYDSLGYNHASRTLDYTGFRTYIVPVSEIDLKSVNEFQIGIWGSDSLTIYISDLQLVHNSEIEAHKYEEVIDEKYLCQKGDCQTYTTYYKSCSCGLVSDETFAKDEYEDHAPKAAVEENRVGSTCTEAGSYETVVYCGVCNKELSRTKVDLELLDHEEQTIEAVAPKCEATGLTEGKKCSVCDKVLVAQEEVPALGHNEVVDPAVTATCKESGKTEGKHCSLCNEVLVAQEEVPALGHNEVVDSAVAATCEEVGKTEGKHCSLCNEVLVPQEEIPALGHRGGTATTTDKAICEVCGESYGELLPDNSNTNSPIIGCMGSVVSSLLGIVALTSAVFVIRKKRED